MKILSLRKEEIVPLIEMKEALELAEEAYRASMVIQKTRNCLTILSSGGLRSESSFRHLGLL